MVPPGSSTRPTPRISRARWGRRHRQHRQAGNHRLDRPGNALGGQQLGQPAGVAAHHLNVGKALAQAARQQRVAFDHHQAGGRNARHQQALGDAAGAAAELDDQARTRRHLGRHRRGQRHAARQHRADPARRPQPGRPEHAAVEQPGPETAGRPPSRSRRSLLSRTTRSRSSSRTRRKPVQDQFRGKGHGRATASALTASHSGS